MKSTHVWRLGGDRKTINLNIFLIFSSFVVKNLFSSNRIDLETQFQKFFLFSLNDPLLKCWETSTIDWNISWVFFTVTDKFSFRLVCLFSIKDDFQIPQTFQTLTNVHHKKMFQISVRQTKSKRLTMLRWDSCFCTENHHVDY